MQGFRNAMEANNIEVNESSIVNCCNDESANNEILLEVLQGENKPDGIISSVEKLIAPVYSLSHSLKIKIPGDLKVVCFSNLSTAHILNPALTTITQPAFEMGEMAATVLFKALQKSNYNWQNENIIIPSKLYIRESSAG